MTVNERDEKRATDEANLKAKRAQEKQNERDQKRAMDEVTLILHISHSLEFSRRRALSTFNK